MRPSNKKHLLLSVVLLAVSLTIIGLRLAPTTEIAEQADLSLQEVIEQAWQTAIASGTYEYDTSVEHKVYPVPKLSNSGRQPTTDFLAVAGQIDQEQDLLEMTIWQDAGRHPSRGITLKVENGITFGRVGEGEWEEMDDLTSLFAPGRDPLGFLATIKNINENGQDVRQLGELTLTYNRFTFELDGDAYASHMERQMRDHLQQFGSLPPGMRFSTTDVYRQATGIGEIWIDSNGLPARMTINLDIPAFRENGRTVSNITTDFSGFDQEKIESVESTAAISFWNAPNQWLILHNTEVINAIHTSSIIASILFISLCTLLLTVRYWRTPKFHIIISSTIVCAIVLPPIISAEQAHAFAENLVAYEQEKTAGREEATALEEARAQLNNSNWNPHTNPLESNIVKTEATELKQNLRSDNYLLTNASDDFVNSTDSDGDGLLDADEELWGTCAYVLNSADYNSADTCDGITDPTDTDGDTLTDGVEVNDLGSSPLSTDTDEDGLTDDLEIGGFDYNGQTWYSAFNDDDTNKDGIVDGAECLIWFEGSADYDSTAICPDTDADGTPDLFDDDNDGDKVPDDQDLSPNSYTETDFDYDNPFLFSADNLEEDKFFLLDLQFRPTYDDNLNLYNHVLDWPTNDTEGQITRYLDTTWADTENSDIQSDDDNAANGDIRLVPMLEITMPYSDGHYASLPITSTAPAGRVLGEAADTWLDEDQLDPFSITVEDVDTDSGDLVAYVPIIPVLDEYDTTVAYSTQMLYQPTQGTNGTADWGNDHEFRVVWLVQMITDQCIDEDEDEETCDREDVMTVIHSYYEEWELTGLNGSEEHGLESAIVYEDPAQDDDLDSDDQLWLLSWNMGNTFLRGRDCEIVDGDTCSSNTDGERDVTVANLDSSIDGWLTSGRYLEVENFSYDHSSYMSYLVATEATDILDTTFTAYANDTIPTFMYVHESETRSLNLDDNAFSIGNSLTLDFDPSTVEKSTMAYMSWTPYDYVSGTWTSHDTESYLDILEARLDLDDYFEPADDSDTSTYEATGKVLWAQMYYSSLMEGAGALIEVDSETIFTPVIDGPLDELDYGEILPDGAGSGASSIMSAYVSSLIPSLKSLPTSVDEYFTSIGKTWSQSAKQYTFSFYKQFKNGAYINISTNVLTGMVLKTAIIGAALLAIGYFSGNETVFRAGIIILSVVTIVVTGVYAINAIKTARLAYTAAKAAQAVDGIWDSTKTILGAARGFTSVGALGFAVGLLIAWGLFAIQVAQGGLSSFEINALLAFAIAGTIITVVLLIFDLLGFGVLGMILTIIDAILTVLGEQSATEWFTEAIAEFLYDVHMVIKNLESSDRLEIDMKTFDFTEPALGFGSNNSFIFSYEITNTLKYNDRFSRDTAEYRNTFVYDLDTDPNSTRYTTLDKGDMTDDWINAGDERIQTNDRLTITIPMGDIGYGVNQEVELYLIESFFTSYEGCWFYDGLFGADGCDWGNTAGDTPIDLGDSLVYDILPASVQVFARMDWDDSLPAPVDEDADGLPSTDGTDPNDNDADTDGDGLLDTYEVSYGLDYQLADADNDGLTDAEELDLDTNPLASDTDDDGLNDYIETKVGWLIIYNGNELTRVYSDPNAADIDEDGLSDLDEFLFGFNPWVATDPSIIDTLVEFDDLTVEEETNLHMLFRMEENANAEVFVDSSGNGVTGSCDASTNQCPTAELIGRYGNGLFFDGDDAITTDLALDVEEFTTAAWIYNTADDTGFHAIMGYQSGGTTTRAPSVYVTDQTKIHAGFSDGTWSGFTTGDILTQNQWQHVATSFDGTTYRVYIDGTDVYSTTTMADKDPISFSNYNIGQIDNYFEGNIDEAAFFDKALTEDEIGDLMNGRYNANDLYAAPGTSLNYRATITNSTSTSATGFLVPETGYIDPELPEVKMALSFEQDQRLAYFKNRVWVDDTPLYCTFADDTCPSSGEESQIGSSIAFDGVNDYLTLPGLIGHYDQSISIFFWLYVESIPETGEIAMILDSESTAAGTLDIYLNSDGKLVAKVDDGVTVNTGYNFGNNLETWVHVGFNRDQFYVNYGSNGGQFGSDDDPKRIGPGRLGNSLDGKSPFHGRIDELVVYNNDVDSDDVDNVGNGSYNVEILQAKYTFENLIEYEGDIFHNSIDGGQNGQCWGTACPELSEADEGYDGRAILFDGVNDNVLQAGNVTRAEEAEYIFYIKPISYPTAGEVAYIYDTSKAGSDEDYSFNLYMDENGQLTFDGDDIGQTFDTVIALDEWSKIRFWYSKGTTTYKAFLSVNDSKDSQDISICSGSSTTCDDETQFISWGRIGNNIDLDSPFHGYIDDVSINIAEYDFDPAGSSIGYENAANDLRTASCDDVFLCASVSDGKYGDGVYFDGSDDFLNLGKALNASTTNFTVGLWFKMNEQNDDHTILDQVNGQVWLAVSETGQLVTELSGSSIIGGTPAVDEWHYATLTYDGTTLRLYLDGELTNSGDVNPNFSGGNVYLGISEDNILPFSGNIDELIVLTEAADKDQIAFLMGSTYPALETANDFETYTAGPLSSTEVVGSANIAENLPTSRYQFDLEVEAALELQTQIDFPIIDDNSNDLSVYIPFEDTPGSTTFDNLIPYEGFFDVLYDVEAVCYDDSCPTAGVRGLVGRAASFDGSDDFLEIDISGDNYDGSSSGLPAFYSASMWVKGKKGTIIDSTHSAVTGSGVRIDFGRIYQYDESNDRITTSYSTQFNMSVDEWTHIALTIDQITNEGIVYIDGQQVITGTHFTDEESDLWTIGANFGQQNFFEGLIDDLRVYGVTLTESDVIALYEESAPVLRFEFDEDDTATSFADESPNSYIGHPLASTEFNSTLSETVTTLSPAPGTDGKIGNTALFDGSGYIEVDGTDPLGALTSDVTLMAWVKTNDPTTTQYIATSGRDNSNNGIGFSLYDGGLRFIAWGGKWYSQPATIEADVWQHVAVTLDSDYDAHFYIDGEFVGTITHNSSPSVNSDDPLFIGAHQNESGNFNGHFDGQIDELAIYRRDLSEAEINGIYLQEYRWYRANSINEIQVDLDAPVIEYLSDADYRAEGYIQLSVAIRDTHSYINTFDFGVKGPNDGDFNWQSAPTCIEAAATGRAWCPYFDTADYGGEGVYEVQFRVVDAVGNETTSDSYTIFVDGQAPTTTTSYSDQFLDATEIGTLEWTLNLNGNVSDPEVATGIEGSGVVSNTLQLGLFDSSGGLIEDGWQTVTLSDTDWSIDYRFSGERPSGTYTVTLSAYDNIGNSSTLELGTITLDERAPSAEANSWELPSEVISDTTTISGTVVEQPDWGDAIAEYHFETDAADTTFYDSSGYDYHVSCTDTGDCPTADLSGPFGQALAFDGVDDYMTASSSSPEFSDESFTIAAWINHDDSSDQNTIVSQKAGDGDSAGWALRLNGSNKPLFFVANGSAQWKPKGETISAGEWHHIAGVVDRSTSEVYLYVDGILVATESGMSGSVTSSDAFMIGRWDDGSDQDLFDGSIDEIVLFERALNETEIYALAQDEVEGVDSVELFVEEQDLSTVVRNSRIANSVAVWQYTAAANGTWQPATVNNGAWNYQLPTNTEGFYTAQLRTTDNNGNTADEGLIWRGTIDDIAPRIVASGQQFGGSNAAETEYTFTFSDFILDENSFSHPCETGDLNTYAYADESLPQDGTTYEVNATCRIDGHEASRDFTACDIFGSCTTVTVNPTTTANGNIVINSPAEGYQTIEFATINFSGGTYDPTEIISLTLYANGVEIARPTFSGNDSTWSASWSTGDITDYQIDAVMVGTNGTVTDTINISVLQDPLDDLYINVISAENGGGVVTSDPAGIVCAADENGDSAGDCHERYPFTSAVTLTAAANTGSTFSGWTGTCSGTDSCQVAMNDATTITATFTLNQYDLTLTKTGDGNGEVTSDPADLISCGSTGTDCSETLYYGTVVTLTATPGLETVFNGWGGTCSGNTPTCAVEITEAKNVTADFALNQYTLTTTISGDGSGTLTSDPTGISCVDGSGECDETLAYGSLITLTAAADGTSVFTGWEGVCSGLGNCPITLTTDTLVTATFAHSTYDLSLTVDGDGPGTISSTPAGISCSSGINTDHNDSDCDETINYDTVVTLTASYDPSQMALAWGDSCSAAAGDSCVVTMNQAHNVTVTFTLGEFSLGTFIDGNGNGSISTAPAGIACEIDGKDGAHDDVASGTCNNSFTASSYMTLTAAAGHESVFAGWEGNCIATDEICVVHLTQTEQVTATFALNQYDFVINQTGNGEGTIESSAIGLNCQTDCGITYNYDQPPITLTVDYGTILTMTAEAGIESQFDGWSGGCTGTADCQITLDQSKALTSTFVLNEYALTVGVDGNGSGAITSDPAGIACVYDGESSSGDCTEEVAFGTVITLTPAANSGSIFVGWSGSCGGVDACTVPISQTESVTATFTLMTHTLDVSLTGDGSGTVSDDLNQLNCGSESCQATYDHNTPLVLVANPAVGSTFSEWLGGCVGNGVCVLTIDQTHTVTATFDLIPVQETITHTLTVTLLGDGSGTVSSDPAGMSCSSGVCGVDFVGNTQVTLTASSAAGSQFESWGGACAGETSNTCTVPMNRAKTVTASFRVEPVVSPMPHKVYLPLTTR